MINSKITLQDALNKLKRRAHIHKNSCYGQYEPELVIVLDEFQRLLHLSEMENKNV